MPMNKTFTRENLLLFAYGDFPDSVQKQSVSNTIRNDNILYEDYLEITEMKQLIDDSFINPSDKVINKILAYSKALADLDVADPELRLMIQN